MKTWPYDYSVLPPHIICDILKYLNNRQLLEASRTCKSWYFESLQPKLNKNIRVQIKSAAVPGEFSRPFGRLLIEDTDFNKFKYHEFMTQFGQHIHEIEFEYCQFSLDQLFDFLVYLPNLSAIKLKLNDNHILNEVNSIEGNKNILVVKSIFKRIKSIDLLLSYPDQGGLKYIMRLMPNLKVISIGNHKASENYVFNILFDYLNQFDGVNFDRLSISDLEGEPAQQFFSDFANIIPNLNIHTFNLGMIWTSNYNMTYHEENFTEFCIKLSGVSVFSMRGPRECHFTDICQHMTNLKELNLTYAAIKHFGGIECLKNLEKLHLTSTVCYRGSNYDEDEFMNMFTKLEHLKELSTNLYPITDRVLNAICKNCINLTRLEMLRIMTCNFVPIFKNLIKLKILRLQLSARVEYKAFEVDQNITNLQLLEALDINAFVPGLTLELILQLPNLNGSSRHMLSTNVFNKYGFEWYMESNTTVSDFSLLPPHVITEIFKFLNFRQRLNAAGTCKSWYFASCDPIIWKNTRVRLSHKLNRLEQLHRPFGTLIMDRLEFNQFSYYPELFAKFGQYIRELDFYHCNLSLQQFFDCVILTTNLVSLTIIVKNELFASDINLNDEQVSVVKKNFKCVKNFKIELDSPNSCGVRSIMRMMPNLETLDFCSTDYCDTYVYKNLFEYFNMSQEGINLNRLSIGRLFGSNSVEFFNDFSKISQNLNVRELVLESIDGDIFQFEYEEKFDLFCKKFSAVRKLTMRSIGENQLYLVSQYMTQLTEANFTGLLNQNIRPIGNIRNLQKLTLCSGYCYREVEGQLLGIFTKLQQLKELRLDYEVFEGTLTEICVTCKNLTILELSRMQTNKCSIIFKNLTKLKRLLLTCWLLQPDFTNDCDITNLQYLEELNINYLASGMTIELIEKLPNLRSESLLNIKNRLQTGYVDPELEDTYKTISGLFE